MKVLPRLGQQLSTKLKAMVRRKHRRPRVHQFEQLEARRVLAAAVWNNVGYPFNVNGDEAGVVSPIDALLVINELNQREISSAVDGKLPKQVDEVLSGRFFDVSCDNFVSPLDALLVINHINAGESGSGATNGGVFADAACSPQLVEGNQFASEFEQLLTLPDDSSAVKVHFQAPEFDTASRQTIRDAFEIEVSDLDGNLISFPYLADREAVYNWSEELEPVFGAGVATTTAPSGQDSTATINLAGLPAGTQVRVTARLVNNDLDDNTSVILRGFEIIDVTEPAPRGVAGQPERSPGIDPIDFGSLSDITGSFAPSYGRTTLSGDNAELTTELLVTNVGSQAVAGRVVVAIDNISSLDAYAMHPDGFTPDGSPYFDLTPEMDGQALGPGESLRSRTARLLEQQW